MRNPLRWALAAALAVALSGAFAVAAPPALARDGEAPSLAIGQLQPGNVFTRPQPVEFTAATAGSPPPDTVSWRILDLAGTRVASGSRAVTGASTAIRPAVRGNGYFRLELSAQRAGTVVARAQTSFAVLDAFRVPQDSPFGFSTHFGQSWSPALMPLLAKAGASTLRDEMYWNVVEPAPGAYQIPAGYDAYLAAARSSRINPLIVLSYTNPHYDNDATPYTDAGRTGFANYGAAILDRYPDQIRSVEVYNEFNAGFGDRGDGPADSKPEYYLPLLKAAYERVKAGHPETTVAGPAISFVDPGWLETLFQLGGLKYLDAVSVHYPGNPPERIAESLAGLRELIRRYNNGQDKPIWVTEDGWSTTQAGDDERSQAANVVRAQVVALSQGVERFYWYDFMNDGVDPACHECNFGLVRNDSDPLGRWTPKPSYASYATMTRTLAGARFEGAEPPGPGIQSFRFRSGDRTTRVLWSTTGAQQVTVRTPVPVTVTDLMGNSETYGPDHGQITLSLSDDPIYLGGPAPTVLEAGGRYTLRAPPAVVAGEPIPLTLDVDNTRPPRAPIHARLRVGDATVAVDVAPGRRATIPIAVPDRGATGRRDLLGRLTVDGRSVARLTTRTDVLANPFTVTATHVRRGDADALSVDVTNLVQSAQQAGSLAWQIGTVSGSTEITAPVPGGATHTVDIPTTGLAVPGRYPYQLRLAAPGRPELTYAGTLSLVGSDTIRPVPRRSIAVDGVLDDLSDLDGVDLATDGVVKMNDYGGPTDLGGQAWLTWDEDNLYLSAAVTDNAHAQPGTNEGIWVGDSIQFGVAVGTPGESARYYEYGIALTGAGPQAYRWSSIGPPVGPVTDVTLRVTRDESSGKTVYELALPWTDLSPFESADRLMSFSMLVNDNDGATRKGWIEWGSGIGSGKDPSLFKPVQLM